METRYAERVVAQIRELCAKLDIPPKDCQKAVEYYRKNRRLFQGSKPKNAAATALHVAAGVPLAALRKLGIKDNAFRWTLNKARAS